MPNLHAPARLAYWPEFPWDQGRDYDTLTQALGEAAQHPTETPWIVTLSGKILKPREITDLIRTLQSGGTGGSLTSRRACSRFQGSEARLTR